MKIQIVNRGTSLETPALFPNQTKPQQSVINYRLRSTLSQGELGRKPHVSKPKGMASRKQQTISRVLKYSNSQLLIPSGVKMTFQWRQIYCQETPSAPYKEVLWEEETRLREKQPGRRVATEKASKQRKRKRRQTWADNFYLKRNQRKKEAGLVSEYTEKH